MQVSDLYYIFGFSVQPNCLIFEFINNYLFY
jgi:hypothetical protein